MTLAAFCRWEYHIQIFEQHSYDSSYYLNQATVGISLGGWARALFGSDYNKPQTVGFPERAIENTHVLTIEHGKDDARIEISSEDRVWMTSWPAYHNALSKLVESSTSALPAVTVTKNAVVTDARRKNGSWEITYRKEGIEGSATADVLVAADGARSTVRNKVLGSDRLKTYQEGRLAWRGRLPATLSLLDAMDVEPKGTLVWLQMRNQHILLQVACPRLALPQAD